MKKRACCLMLLFSVSVASLFAQAKPQSKPIPPAKDGRSGEMAIVFNFQDLIATAGPYNDGFQTGAGLKYWLLPNMAMRALLGVLVTPDPLDDTSTTNLGFSLAAELHLKPGKASPYVGAVIGTKFLIEPDTTYMDYFLGGIGGVELKLFDNFALYAEYQALLTSTIDGLGFELGNQALLGFAIYF